MYKVSDDSVKLIKRFEGFKAKAYLDPVGVWTIGYGTTKGVKKGMKVTRQQAEKMLAEHLDEEVIPAIEKYVKVSLTQPMVDALSSFIYNVGVSNFRKSTLLKVLNRGNYKAAYAQFGRWVYARDRRTGKRIKLKGLIRRRKAEADLFYKGILEMDAVAEKLPKDMSIATVEAESANPNALKELLVYSNTFKAVVAQITALAAAFANVDWRVVAVIAGVAALFILYRRFDDIKERL